MYIKSVEYGQKAGVAVFGGGCFWCTEAIFEELRGVVYVVPGYAGGRTENPTYEEVCGGRTGHAEVIKIEFDPAQISYENLLTVFFATHDPTTTNRQGNDAGEQYRSVIFYTNDGQKKAAEEFIRKLNASEPGGKPVVTAVEPLKKFYEAEEYHREYYKKNPRQPYCEAIITPKMQKLQRQFSELLKSHGKKIDGENR